LADIIAYFRPARNPRQIETAFGVFRYFLPDFHFSLGRNKPSKRR